MAISHVGHLARSTIQRRHSYLRCMQHSCSIVQHVAIPGYAHFESVLENFMLVIAYWLAIYEGIALPEHFIFRGGMSGYIVSTYDQPSKLPPSFAALGAFCFGIVGAVLGMAQVWFLGPVGRMIGGQFGGDVGFELAFAFSLLSYCVLRYFEKKRFGR